MKLLIHLMVTSCSSAAVGTATCCVSHWCQAKGTLGKCPWTRVSSKSPVNSSPWVRQRCSCCGVQLFHIPPTAVVSRNLPLCVPSVHTLKAFISKISFFSPPFISASSFLPSPRGGHVDLSSAEGRHPLPPLIAALLSSYPRPPFCLYFPALIPVSFRNIMAWTPG